MYEVFWWRWLFRFLGVAIGLSYLIIIIMRWIAGPIILICILLFVGFFAFGITSRFVSLSNLSRWNVYWKFSVGCRSLHNENRKYGMTNYRIGSHRPRFWPHIPRCRSLVVPILNILTHFGDIHSISKSEVV